MIPITDHALQLHDVPKIARPYFKKTLPELTRGQRIVKKFHKYLRYKTPLSSGTTIDYVKAAHYIFVEDQDPEDVTNGQPTVDKMKEMVETRGARRRRVVRYH